MINRITFKDFYCRENQSRVATVVDKIPVAEYSAREVFESEDLWELPGMSTEMVVNVEWIPSARNVHDCEQEYDFYEITEYFGRMDEDVTSFDDFERDLVETRWVAVARDDVEFDAD